jgi:hypothetical protein
MSLDGGLVSEESSTGNRTGGKLKDGSDVKMNLDQGISESRG